MNKEKINNNGNYKKKIIISFIFYITTIFFNWLSNMRYINGKNQGDISRMFPTEITPAAYAFIIWGIIYFLIFLAILVTLINKNQKNIQVINSTAHIFWGSCFFNVAWTIVFSYKMIGLSVVFILCLLISIFLIMLKLNKIRDKKNILFDIGFGLYAGWLSVATVVNFIAFLVSIKFDFFKGQKNFCSFVLLLLILLISSIQEIHKNPFYNLAIIWAFIAIIVRFSLESYTSFKIIVLIFGIITLSVVDYYSIRSVNKKM